MGARNRTSSLQIVLGSRSMFTPLSLTETVTVCTGWKTDQTGSFRLQDLAGRASFKASVSAALHQKSKCSATLTGMCQPRKTCEIWNYYEHASAWNYPGICGAIRTDTIVSPTSACDRLAESRLFC